MKNEHRHFLETNWLAARLAKWIEKLKPHTGSLVGGLMVLLGIAVVSSFWSSQSATKRQAAWDEFATAHNMSDPELASLRQVADKEEYSGTPMREWAYVTWADRQVLLASSEYLVNRENAQGRLPQLVGIYEGLAGGAADVVVQNRAHFGLARVYELQNKLEEARGEYSLVEGDLQPMATYRADQLEQSKVQEACAWLASAKLLRRSGEGVGGEAGALGTRPDFEASLPDASLESDLPDARSLEEILGTLGEATEGEDTSSEALSSDEAASDEAETDAEEVETKTDADAEADAPEK
ncbi:MAG: hypothetical protein GXP28_01075 [Planctomycetes bacterium]|nr:hypothetical protein [Planctomycetota bacterium]